MRRLGFSESLPPQLQQWTDGGGGVVLGLVVSGDGLGGGRFVFGFIDGWMEVVGLGLRWFHCMAFSESEFIVRRSIGVL